MKTIFTTAACLLLVPSLVAQSWNWSWAHSIGSAAEEDQTILVKTGPNDEVYVALEYLDALTIGSDNYPAPDAGGKDILLAKYDASGNLQWSISVSGDGSTGTPGLNDLLHGLEVDAAGNIYLFGNLGNNASIAGTAVNNTGNRNFLAKFSDAGALSWHITADENFTNDYFRCLTVEASGDVLLGGQTGPSGSGWYAIDGVLLNGGQTFTDNNPPFLARIASDGTVQWVRTIDGATPTQIVSDADGNIYLASAGGQTPATTGYYLIKLDPTGQNKIWERFQDRILGSDTKNHVGLKLRSDQTLVHFLRSGSSAAVDFGDGFASSGGLEQDLGMVWHIDSSGQTLSLYEMVDLFQNVIVSGDFAVEFNSFDMQGDDTYYLGGRLTGGATLADGTNLTPSPWILPQLNGRDALVFKLDSGLNILGTAFQTGSGRQDGESVAFCSNGDAVLAGWFLNPSSATTEFGSTSLTTIGNEEDYFVTRVSTGMPNSSHSQVFEAPDFEQFPVPAGHFIQVQVPQGVDHLEIWSMQGQLVKSQSISGSGLWQVELDGIPAGAYLTRLTGKGLNLQAGFIKH